MVTGQLQAAFLHGSKQTFVE